VTVERVVVIGSGGHAREVLQILLSRADATGGIEPLGFVDEDAAAHGRTLDGFPVLGGWEWLEGADRDHVSVVVAVGTPVACERLAGRARLLGLRIARAVSPQAWVASTATLGEGAIVFPGAVVNTQARVGDHVTLNVAATVSHDSRIGAFTIVGPGAHIAGNVTLGDGCFVGMGANLIHGVRVGAGSVIGAGAVVLDDVPERVTVVGVPARVVGPATANPMARSAEERARARA
jgi:sugar O-acyltransferase (sialic acid O-acetyltransferase NeuD family)